MEKKATAKQDVAYHSTNLRADGTKDTGINTGWKERSRRMTYSEIRKNEEVLANLQIDPKICSMYEYFEIFLGRMMMCKRAAEVLEASFKLTVNGSKVL